MGDKDISKIIAIIYAVVYISFAIFTRPRKGKHKKKNKKDKQ